MRCPKCQHETRVYSTESKPDETFRRRKCINLKCGHRFKTWEVRAGKYARMNMLDANKEAAGKLDLLEKAMRRIIDNPLPKPIADIYKKKAGDG